MEQFEGTVKSNEQKNLLEAHLKLAEAMEAFSRTYEAVYSEPFDKTTSLQILFSFNQHQEISTIIIPATFEENPRVIKTGLVPGEFERHVKVVLSPETSKVIVTRTAMEVLMNHAFYEGKKISL